MPYFSRLTDIVTCNLSAILQEADDPAAVLDEILREMDQGLVASQRSVRTATDNLRKINDDIDRQRAEVEHWSAEAKQRLQAGDEAAARSALLRKNEAASLIGGLDQSRVAAEATLQQLTTTYHAIHARLSDARRRQAELTGDQIAAVDPPSDLAGDIDAELEALRAEL